MTDNPFESTQTNEVEPTAISSIPNDQVVRYRGGIGGVVGLGLLIAVVGMGTTMLTGVIAGNVLGEVLVFAGMFGAPAVVWIGGIFFLTKLLHPLNLSNWSRFGIALLATIPCYILFVPTCCCLSIVADSVIPRTYRFHDYGPSQAGLIVGTITSFMTIFLPAAALLRLAMLKRQRRLSAESPEIVVSLNEPPRAD